MITHQKLKIITLHSIILIGTFFADVFLFSIGHHSLLQLTLSLFIASALLNVPQLVLACQMIALCLLSLLFFGSIEPYLFLALLILAFARFFNLVLHQRALMLFATTASTFIAYHLLLMCTYYTPCLWYTVEQFCANLIMVLVLFIIFEKGTRYAVVADGH